MRGLEDVPQTNVAFRLSTNSDRCDEAAVVQEDEVECALCVGLHVLKGEESKQKVIEQQHVLGQETQL